jgi:uncharacterized protein (DUF1684 family)
MKNILLSVIMVLMLYGCKPSTRFDPAAYYTGLAQWDSTRIASLKAPNGWLNLAGLFWLEEGVNTFGADSANKIVFPPNAPAFCGSIIKNRDTLVFEPVPGSGITINGAAADRAVLATDAEAKADLMEFGSLAWFIIKRDTLYAIRLRDYEHPRIAQLHEIPRYEPDAGWRKTASFVAFKEADTLYVPTSTGREEMYLIPGKLVFEHEGTKQELLPFRSENGFFIIIGDRTSGLETYAAGRFMYCDPPDRRNRVILDFNKAYNPPCAFSPFATCPLPPPENRLKIAVTAGEKAVHLQ